jgi:hypothetical protein
VFEAVALVLWLTVWFALECMGVLLAVLIEVLVLLKRLVVWLWRAGVALVRDVRGWRRAPRDLAVRRYPAPRRVPPRASAPLPPPEVKR